MDATQLADIFKDKAMELKAILNPHVTPELRLAAIFMEAMAPSILCSAFHMHVCLPYKSKIEQKDAVFFMNPANLVSGADPTLATLKVTWNMLDDDDKEDTWALLKQMSDLSTMFTAL